MVRGKLARTLYRRQPALSKQPNSSREFRLFSRYLVGEEPDSILADRYARACGKLLGQRPPDRVVRMAVRWPALLGPLDAASAFLQKDGQLRSRLLIAAAILEATPRHAEAFLPQHVSRARLLGEFLLAGVANAVKLAVGIPLLLVVRK